MESAELDQFIKSMLDAKKLTGINDEVRDQLTVDLKERLLDQINKALIDAVPDEKMDEFEALLDDESTSDESVQDFIAHSGVDVKSVTSSAMVRFYDLYVSRSGERGI